MINQLLILLTDSYMHAFVIFYVFVTASTHEVLLLCIKVKWLSQGKVQLQTDLVTFFLLWRPF